MSISSRIREQIIGTFRVELAEHVQTITDGLLKVEQQQLAAAERQEILESIFRAAHSLKGAARAVGVTAVEQLGHALENVLSAFQRGKIEATPALFTACYGALDAIQAVEAAYEAGETTPPLQTLQAIAILDSLRPQEPAPQEPPAFEPEPIKNAPTSVATAAWATTLAAPAAAATPIFMPGEQDEPAGPGAGSPALPAAEDTIRVRLDKLDTLVGQLSELIVAKIRLEEHLSRLREMQSNTATWQKNWVSVRDNYGAMVHRKRRTDAKTTLPGHLDRDKDGMDNWLSSTQDWIRGINVTVSELVRDYNNDIAHTALVIDALEQEVKSIRMLPLSTITGTFGRMLRDMAYSANKEAAFELVGGDVEMDKHVLEKIKDPLIHLLRNAVDHGIELPDEREALGKPRAGKVTLTAEQLGKDVVIAISDDGRGLDLEAVRKTVADNKHLDALSLDEPALVNWIFNPGISTSGVVTELSGRGVGLDVVRRNVDLLQGRIEVDWKAGAGSTFSLILPMSLTSSRILLVEVAAQVYAVPVSVVERLLTIFSRDFSYVGGQSAIIFNGRPLPIYYLADILGTLRRKNDLVETEALQVMVISAADRQAAFIVDGLLGEQEIVIKGLGRQLVRVGGVGGATILGNGKVVLVLNAADLVKLAFRGERSTTVSSRDTLPVPPIETAPKRILVVDDSITTRTLERNILEAKGFIVELATNGHEALASMLSNGIPDLVITDVSMPLMNGFELARHIKSDLRTADLPVILVTSLDSADDKARGVECGADAYIVKSRFDQGNLLETIQQLIG